ncbi:hypothetical protein [Candidatus Thiosymbion oneisti]|uniref:hypothetical protein n=1 Tax=Candidatus Thiosymbion oneisti TaxID=589554 RepID=UPI00105D4A83|nr:hypothetical protein [Candidatus Thiosymbion oneisti]
MTTTSGIIRAKVLSVWKITNFEGDAILAGADPRFVIAFQILDSQEQYNVAESDVVLNTHRVVFFAVHSIVQLFMESDVEGKTYDIKVTSELYKGNSLYYLQLTEF